ncbi:hypothetical protein ACHWQZ_G009256 [Mnemiopsis leidyi]
MASDNDKKLERALDLMRRVPPQNTNKHLGDLIDICPSLTEELLSAVDQPLSSKTDDLKEQDFIICDYNRDGDSYRSPWSNLYYPYISDGYLPPIQLRTIEEELNEAFKIYMDMYYGEEALSSVYVWDIDNGFAAAILFKKMMIGENSGCWDAINIMEVTERLGRPSHYKLTTTVMTRMRHRDEESGYEMNIGGSLMRQKEEDLPSDNGHMVNIGQLVEGMENNIRQQIESVYFGKTRDIVNGVRSLTNLSEKKQFSRVMNAELTGAISKRKPLE